MRGKWHSINLAARRGLLGIAGLGGMSCASPLLAAELNILPVPSIVIYPGEVIKDNCLVDQDFSAGFAASKLAAIGTRAAIVGKVARRTLLPGSPVPLNAVADPRAVSNGGKVRILFQDGVLAITAYGTALQAGSAGDIISVRNLGSGLTIWGTVQADGSVRAGGG